MRHLRTLVATTAAFALVLSACSSGESSDGEAGFNDADVAFASDMVQHHAQALSMVDLTMGRDLSPEVADLAEEIRDAQAPEIETMVGWLREWDQPVPETSRDHANAHGGEHGEAGADMPGMMSAEQMTALEDASDAEFEALWLSMMIEHHQGAVEMAEEVLERGEHEPTASLAGDVIEAQESEIETMEELLER
jgi:uncharacterized protein (DUF305 family)